VWFNTEDEDEGDEDAEGQEDEEPQEITSDTRISGAEIDVIIQITLVDKSVCPLRTSHSELQLILILDFCFFSNRTRS